MIPLIEYEERACSTASPLSLVKPEVGHFTVIFRVRMTFLFCIFTM